MSLIYCDSMLWIYHFEENAQFGERVAQIWNRIHQRGDQICLSMLGAAEVLSGPHRNGNWDLYSTYLKVFRSPELRLLEFKLSTAEVYAEIRSRHKIAPPDAMHLACASEARVDLFLTHDKQLAGKIVPGIQFIVTLDSDIL